MLLSKYYKEVINSGKKWPICKQNFFNDRKKIEIWAHTGLEKLFINLRKYEIITTKENIRVNVPSKLLLAKVITL